MLANHYKRLTTATNGLNTLRICCENALFANFRSVFLIFVTPQNRSSVNAYESLRMLCDHAAIIANWWRIAFVSPFLRYSLRCKSSITAIENCCITHRHACENVPLKLLFQKLMNVKVMAF